MGQYNSGAESRAGFSSLGKAGAAAGLWKQERSQKQETPELKPALFLIMPKTSTVPTDYETNALPTVLFPSQRNFLGNTKGLQKVHVKAQLKGKFVSTQKKNFEIHVFFKIYIFH